MCGTVTQACHAYTPLPANKLFPHTHLGAGGSVAEGILPPFGPI